MLGLYLAGIVGALLVAWALKALTSRDAKPDRS